MIYKSLQHLFDMKFLKNIFEQKILVLHYILTAGYKLVPNLIHKFQNLPSNFIATKQTSTL